MNNTPLYTGTPAEARAEGQLQQEMQADSSRRGRKGAITMC